MTLNVTRLPCAGHAGVHLGEHETPGSVLEGVRRSSRNAKRWQPDEMCLL